MMQVYNSKMLCSRYSEMINLFLALQIITLKSLTLTMHGQVYIVYLCLYTLRVSKSIFQSAAAAAAVRWIAQVIRIETSFVARGAPQQAKPKQPRIYGNYVLINELHESRFHGFMSIRCSFHFIFIYSIFSERFLLLLVFWCLWFVGFNVCCASWLPTMICCVCLACPTELLYGDHLRAHHAYGFCPEFN